MALSAQINQCGKTELDDAGRLEILSCSEIQAASKRQDHRVHGTFVPVTHSIKTKKKMS